MFLIRHYPNEQGGIIDATTDRDDWLQIRRSCVGATDARKLAKLTGEKSKQWDSLLWEKVSNRENYTFDSYERGIEREPLIAEWVTQNFPEEHFVHNSALLQGANPRHVATPDMVGHNSLCEIKVSTSSLKKGLTTYRDQLQWQMHVTGSDFVLFVVENRENEEIECEWVERNQQRIEVLEKFADQFLIELDELVESSASNSEYFEVESFSPEDFLGSSINFEVDDSPQEIIWTKKELSELVARYCLGQDIYTIASALDIEAKYVVLELSKSVLGQTEPLIEETAERFGQSWTPHDVEQLTSMYRLAFSIPSMAQQLGRDKLGICFQLFERFSPAVPKKVLKKYGLSLEILSLIGQGIGNSSDITTSNEKRLELVRFLDFKVGTIVQVIQGPFIGEMGVISDINLRINRATVLISLFDIETPFDLAFEDFEVSEKNGQD